MLELYQTNTDRLVTPSADDVITVTSTREPTVTLPLLEKSRDNKILDHHREATRLHTKLNMRNEHTFGQRVGLLREGTNFTKSVSSYVKNDLETLKKTKIRDNSAHKSSFSNMAEGRSGTNRWSRIHGGPTDRRHTSSASRLVDSKQQDSAADGELEKPRYRFRLLGNSSNDTTRQVCNRERSKSLGTKERKPVKSMQKGEHEMVVYFRYKEKPKIESGMESSCSQHSIEDKDGQKQKRSSTKNGCFPSLDLVEKRARAANEHMSHRKLDATPRKLGRRIRRIFRKQNETAKYKSEDLDNAEGVFSKLSLQLRLPGQAGGGSSVIPGHSEYKYMCPKHHPPFAQTKGNKYGVTHHSPRAGIKTGLTFAPKSSNEAASLTGFMLTMNDSEGSTDGSNQRNNKPPYTNKCAKCLHNRLARGRVFLTEYEMPESWTSAESSRNESRTPGYTTELTQTLSGRALVAMYAQADARMESPVHFAPPANTPVPASATRGRFIIDIPTAVTTDDCESAASVSEQHTLPESSTSYPDHVCSV